MAPVANRERCPVVHTAQILFSQLLEYLALTKYSLGSNSIF